MADPLITNKQLQMLLARAKGMSKGNRDTMWEALVFVRGTYERERRDGRVASLKIELAAALADLIEYRRNRYADSAVEEARYRELTGHAYDDE